MKADEPRGLIAGRYRVVKKLGSGAFGSVYRAEQTAFGVPMRTVALKVFQADVSSPTRARAIFNDALQLSNLLQNCEDPDIYAGIIQIYDVGSFREVDPEGRPSSKGYMAMEMMDRDLRAVVGRPGGAHSHRCTVRETLSYLTPVVNALAYMHTRNPPILHRDLKPDNILLRYRKGLRVKIGDFGLAVETFGLLGTPDAAGTLLYQDLEGFTDRSASAASDVFALGVIFYELLTGTYPFGTAYLDVRHEDPVSWSIFLDRARLALTGRIRPPSEINYELKKEAWLESIILACLRPLRAERFKDAAVLKRRLENPGQGGTGRSQRDIYREHLDRARQFAARGPDHYRAAEECYQLALKTTRRFCDAARELAGLYIRQNEPKQLEKAEKLLNKERDLNWCACFYGCLADIYAKRENSILSDQFLRKQKEMGACSRSVSAPET